MFTRELRRPLHPIINYGWRGLPLAISKMYHRRLVAGGPTTPIWESDWDLLIVLDACRAEWAETVADEFSFIESVNTINSVGSHSAEWIHKTFTEEYNDLLAETAYITANHHAKWMKPSNFKTFENLNEYCGVFKGIPAPPAHIVTDRAIQITRQTDWEHCIVHYMQPHKPFLKQTGDRTEVEVANDWSLGYNMYKKHFAGELSKKEIENGFIRNLRYVLEEVGNLLENVDASKVVITSDHGNALGERFLWDHSRGVKHPSMRHVPWLETTAEDAETINPDDYHKTDYDEEKIKKSLKQLGYR